MRYLYTGPDAKKIDEHAMEVVGMPSLVLMERAAMTVAKLLLERESADARFLAVCGTGNNGGDGMAVARILHEMGYKACITIVGYPDSMSNEAKKQAEIAVGCHVPVIPLSSIKDNEFDVIIDAIFGIGLSRDVTDVYEQVIEDINSSDAIIYALDVPSGIHSGTGKVLGCAVKAETTVTFGVNKLGLILHPGNTYAGEVIIADIGFPKESVKSIKTPYHHFEPDDISKLLPARPDRSHKGNYGHVLIVAGSEQMGGAAYLSALGAYRMGAGMVKVISPIANRDFLMGRLPEVLFDEPESLEEQLEWADAIVVGPGLGLDDDAQKTVETIINNSYVPTVIDADAIRLCRNITNKLSENFILTPHMKEMSYLTGKSVDEILNDTVNCARDAAYDFDAIIVCKDFRTVVSDGSECYINVSGNSGMATAGSGDVLSGMIGALLGQGMETFDAAKLGVYIHGLAGDIQAKLMSKNALMASDIADGIGKVITDQLFNLS